MRIKEFVIPVFAIGIIALAVLLAQVTGDWVTSGKQLVSEKAAAGEMTLDDLRGWMSLQQVADYYKLPVGYLYDSLGLQQETVSPETELRELEERVALETTDVREAVGRFLAGELGPENITEEPEDQGEASSSDAAIDLKGRMSLQEVADTYHLPLEELIASAGLPADIDVRIPMRDLKSTLPDFELSVVREAVAELLGN